MYVKAHIHIPRKVRTHNQLKQKYTLTCPRCHETVGTSLLQGNTKKCQLNIHRSASSGYTNYTYEEQINLH